MRVLWGRRTSINVQKVAWMLAECGLQHDLIEVGGAFGKLDTDDYGRLNPNRQVPTLVDGDLVLWESHAICRYLVGTYGGPLAPTDAAAAAQADMWMDWFQASVNGPFTQIFYQTVRLPKAERSKELLDAAIAALSAKFALAEARLERHDYLLSDEISLADVPFGSSLFRYYEVGIDRPDFPAIAAYYDRLCARPAFRDHVKVSFESLRAVN